MRKLVPAIHLPICALSVYNAAFSKLWTNTPMRNSNLTTVWYLRTIYFNSSLRVPSQNLVFPVFQSSLGQLFPPTPCSEVFSYICNNGFKIFFVTSPHSILESPGFLVGFLKFNFYTLRFTLCRSWQTYSVIYIPVQYQTDSFHQPKDSPMLLLAKASPFLTPWQLLICFPFLHFIIFQNIIWMESNSLFTLASFT